MHMQPDFIEMFKYITETRKHVEKKIIMDFLFSASQLQKHKFGFMEIKKLSDSIVGILHTSSRKYFFTLFVSDLIAPTDSTSTFCLCADMRRAAP